MTFQPVLEDEEDCSLSADALFCHEDLDATLHVVA